MKNLKSSDMNPMVLAIMNNATVSLAMPISTTQIWGLNVVPGASTVLWHPAEVGSSKRRQDCTAIWGTCGVGAPLGHAGKPWQAMQPWQAVELSR